MIFVKPERIWLRDHPELKLSDLFIVPCLIYDLMTRGRPHRATVLGGALIGISHPLRLMIGNTHA